MAKITDKLSPNLFNFYTLPDETAVTCDPANFLHPERLDIIPRYIYIKHKALGYGINWASYVYRHALGTLNPDFIEGDGTKHGFSDYIENCDNLIQSFRESGFDAGQSIIPYIDGKIVDGAHRIAAALHYNVNVEAIELQGTNNHVYDVSKYIQRGINRDVLEHIIHEYVRLNSNVHAVVFFPVAQHKIKKATQMLDDKGIQIYSKDIQLSRFGQANLVNLLYSHEKWWGERSQEQLAKRFDAKDKLVHVVFMEFHDNQSPREVKEEIRALYKLGNNPVHINDHHFEACWLAETVLNRNALTHLNAMNHHSMPVYNHLLHRYMELVGNCHKPENYCIDSAGVLAQFGLRDTQDIDYISADATALPSQEQDDISLHNEEYTGLPFQIDEIIYNPKCHFQYKGIKFLSIDTVRLFKQARGEEKDFRDIALINNYIDSDKGYLRTGYRMKMYIRQKAKIGKKILKKPLKPVKRILRGKNKKT